MSKKKVEKAKLKEKMDELEKADKEDLVNLDDLPEEPYYGYISGVIEENGKRYFQVGKLEKECNCFTKPFLPTKRRRVMLIELKAKMNEKQIFKFLKENPFYYDELKEKENPFKEGEDDE